MRDILVTLIVFGSIPFIFKRPYIGILMWAWLSYMNPHRMTYGFAYDMPFAQIIALVLFLAILFNKDRGRIPIDNTMIVWLIFLFWMLITTVFSIYFDASYYALIKVMKIQLLTFLTMMLITNQERINKLVWVIVISIGFFSIKGGVFTILTGGSHKVWGPPSSFIEENNSLALASIMVVPLFVYLYYREKNKWIKYGLAGCALLTLISAVGSQSRGALLAIISVLVFFWLKTKGKIITGIGLFVLVVIGFNFMPNSWHDRMSTIQHYEEDSSAMDRINAWVYSINIASNRIVGGGFDSYSDSTYALYSPGYIRPQAAHSIYFSVLADHGWPGLILFLFVLFMTWKSLSYVIQMSKDNKDLHEQCALANALKVSFIAYLTGGAFLSLAYFDLPWHMIAISLLLKYQVKLATKV